jgi:hypothetical protein
MTRVDIAFSPPSTADLARCASFAPITHAAAADHHDASWTRAALTAAMAATAEFPVETAVRLARLAGKQTFSTRLNLPGRGRFDLLVQYRPSHLAIDIHCETASSHCWLAARQHLLEVRLARVFARPARIATSFGQPA